MTLKTVMALEFFGNITIYFGIGVQVIMALFLGGLVGYDREKKLKSAGIKTNILICLGATLYTSIGILIANSTHGVADPSRMAAQIVSGIGFLGAGAIMQGKGSVVGMTTAATIWVVAAIGFTIGAGYPFTAAIFTITVLVVLKLISPIYRFMENEKDYDFYQMEILSQGSVRRTIKGILENEDYDIDDIYEEDFQGKKGTKILHVLMFAHKRHMERMAYDLKKALKVKDVVYFPISKSISSDSEKSEETIKG